VQHASPALLTVGLVAASLVLAAAASIERAAVASAERDAAHGERACRRTRASKRGARHLPPVLLLVLLVMGAWSHKRAEYVERNASNGRLALVRHYYPTALAARILACCEAQLAGDYRHPCNDPLCPACAPNVNWRHAKRQIEAFSRFTRPGKKAPRVAHEVYTVPPMLANVVLSAWGYKAFQRAVLATIREIHQAPDVAGVMNCHQLGEEDITRSHLHLDCVINGYLVQGGRVVEHRPPHIHYDDARTIYKRHLVREFALAEEPRVVDLWLGRKYGIFTSQRGPAYRIIRYSARNPYQPQFAWRRGTEFVPENERWAYQPKRDTRTREAAVHFFDPKLVMPNLLAQRAWRKGKRLRSWFGYMQDRARAKAAPAFEGGIKSESPSPQRHEDDKEGPR
jgi:hypothetical protein